MILLDTNVVSEAMKPSPNLPVRNWLDAQVAESLFLSSITVAELMFGVGVMPGGKRKDALSGAVESMLALFEERILPFDTKAAHLYAVLATKARAAGRGPDGYIAAIAAAHNFAVATRDISTFTAAGLEVVDPWSFAR